MVGVFSADKCSKKRYIQDAFFKKKNASKLNNNLKFILKNIGKSWNEHQIQKRLPWGDTVVTDDYS